MYTSEKELFEMENKSLAALKNFEQAHEDVFNDSKKMTNLNAVISKLGVSVNQMGLIPAICYYDRNCSADKNSSYAHVLELMSKILEYNGNDVFTVNWLKNHPVDKEAFLLANIALKRAFRTYDFEPKSLEEHHEQQR